MTITTDISIHDTSSYKICLHTWYVFIHVIVSLAAEHMTHIPIVCIHILRILWRRCGCTTILLLYSSFTTILLTQVRVLDVNKLHYETFVQGAVTGSNIISLLNYYTLTTRLLLYYYFLLSGCTAKHLCRAMSHVGLLHYYYSLLHYYYSLFSGCATKHLLLGAVGFRV